MDPGNCTEIVFKIVQVAQYYWNTLSIYPADNARSVGQAKISRPNKQVPEWEQLYPDTPN